MIMRVRILTVILFYILSVSANSDTQPLYMTSLSWPPYSGESLPYQGHTIQYAKRIFASMGYELIVDFYPWARAIALGVDDKSKYIGYLPEYYDTSLLQKCLLSEPIGFSPLGFAQLKTNPITWDNFNDIAELPGIGVVRGYVNSPDLDARIATGNIKADEAISDLENIKKLLAKRIPLIVVDTQVLNYLLTHEPDLMNDKSKIEMNKKLIDKKSLYLCFKKTDNGHTIRDIFNQGLNKTIMKSFLRESH